MNKSDDDIMRNYMLRDRNPHAIVESHYIKGIHNAEVRYRDKQRVVKRGFNTREEAMAYAEGIVKEITDAFDKIVEDRLGQFPLAKE